jgi:hypothetical protein
MADASPTLFDLPADIPALPYGGSSGWAGSETSEERARSADADGTTGRRQRRTLSLLASAGLQGMTWKEIAQETGWHHGTASGALSVLHKVGAIARLAETRSRSAVYVLPAHVAGRPVSGRRTTAGSRLLRQVLAEIDADLAEGRSWEARRRIQATLEMLGEDA